MADIDFPADLPLPQREGYGLEHVSPLLRTELASGRARQRRRFTSVPTTVSVSWVLSEVEAQLFEGWFRYAISDGAAWFNVTIKTPVGLKPYVARFAGMYDGPDLLGIGHWRISAELEIRERQTVDSSYVIHLPNFILYQSIFDQAMNREWPAD
ncbi:hypothetical protein [Aidingimonas halophila]|uniref:Uncharacterized protein n=1 Tax=Aidingimonas halophila TaxID=574349 RepID=A0A1H2RBC1_9GAMM|nr:hypothetical protein [Aidingimonas halophila]GHC19515.1 membrane protein [Aidingimonas halophila]SDW16773.1 hypothetical protein SAMN05443545_101277 [Aidingimonas halophila]